MYAIARPAASCFVDEFFREVERAAQAPATWTPSADIAEVDGGFQVRLELPGVAKESVKVELKENVLSVSGEKVDALAEAKGYRHRETAHGAFSRTFRLSQAIERESIEARFENGVLELRLKHRPEVGPRAIPVA